MPVTDRVLMGPGPCNPYPEVTAALGRPVLGHLDPELIAVLDETCDRLRAAFRTTNPLTFPLSGTGSAGMEAAFVNFARPGHAVVIGVNGVFGERMCDVAARCGAEVIRVEAPWGRPVDPAALLTAHPSPAIIALVHAETSTGVRNDIAPVGEGKGDALLLVDCVTSLGGLPVEIDAWDVDIAYSASQKCLGVPPGLAPLTVSPRAMERLLPTPRSWYLDLNMIARYVTGDGPRAYHHTAPISMLFGLHAGLGVLADEGLEATWKRHEEVGLVLQEGLEARGLALFAAAGHRLPQLCAVWVPEGDRDREAQLRRLLLDRYGIEIGGGLGAQAGRVWRIGLMGHTARLRNVRLLLGALDDVLGS